MFLTILRISASNVLKMFLSVVVSFGSAVVIFQFVQTNQKHKLTATYTLADKKEI